MYRALRRYRYKRGTEVHIEIMCSSILAHAPLFLTSLIILSKLKVTSKASTNENFGSPIEITAQKVQYFLPTVELNSERKKIWHSL